MSDLKLNYIENKTTIFISKMNKIWSFAGLPNVWNVCEYNKKLYRLFHGVATMCIFTFIILEFGAFFTQSSLTDRQSNDLIIFCFSHIVLISYYICLEYQKTEVKELLIKLCITLKNVYNDPDVEMRMIKKTSYYSIAHLMCVSVSLFSYGFDGLMQVIRSDGSFITVVTAWPDVEDNSTSANLVRVVIYIMWWIFMVRVVAAITLAIMTTVALSHQYKNLQSYFHSLNDIFQNDADENRDEKEVQYVEALKVGIKLHSDTMWCTRQCQVTCSLVFSGQILMTISVMCLLMLQMVNSERTLLNALTIICTSAAVLTSTGFIMWSAGDITVEASLVPTAMFLSGWHHCRGSTSEAVRKLLFVAMTQGQKHVVLISFGVIEISYPSYLSIVKSSYSAFSLLY